MEGSLVAIPLREREEGSSLVKRERRERRRVEGTNSSSGSLDVY